MSTLQHQLVERFHLAPEEADRLIRAADARARIKAAIIGSAAEGQRIIAADDDLSSPEAWRDEIRKRMQALEVLQDGVNGLEKCAKLLKRLIQSEQKLIGSKTTTVNHRGMDWWTFNESGWAMGGREMFAQVIADIFSNIDEPKIAKQILDKIGFKRSIPMPDDMPPLAPADPEAQEPGDRGKKDPSEDPGEVPAHAAVMARLVRGAKVQVKALNLTPKVHDALLHVLEGYAGSDWKSLKVDQVWPHDKYVRFTLRGRYIVAKRVAQKFASQHARSKGFTATLLKRGDDGYLTVDIVITPELEKAAESLGAKKVTATPITPELLKLVNLALEKWLGKTRKNLMLASTPSIPHEGFVRLILEGHIEEVKTATQKLKQQGCHVEFRPVRSEISDSPQGRLVADIPTEKLNVTGTKVGAAAIPPHMWVISKDGTGAYIVTIGDPTKGGSTMKRRFSGSDKKNEINEWVRDNVGQAVSPNHIMDLTGLFPKLAKASVVKADFTLGDKDRKVIDAFTSQQAAQGNKLSTDGTKLDGHWMGGSGIAEWRNGKIHFNDLGSRAAQTVQNAVRKSAPKNDLAVSAGRRVIAFDHLPKSSIKAAVLGRQFLTNPKAPKEDKSDQWRVGFLYQRADAVGPNEWAPVDPRLIHEHSSAPVSSMGITIKPAVSIKSLVQEYSKVLRTKPQDLHIAVVGD